MTAHPAPARQAPQRPLPTRLAFVASDRPEAQAARARLAARYGEVPENEAEVVVALGGDGFMLETLHRNLGSERPIYGMNQGSVGFLMNEYNEDGLIERIAAAERAVIHPLVMVALDAGGQSHKALAINEVSMLRQTRQTAKLRLSIDRKERLAELFCDGVLVSTPAGSPPDRQAAAVDRPQGAAGRTVLRRGAGFDPGRIDRLQPVGPRPDHPPRRPRPGPDPDQRLQAAAMAWRAFAAYRKSHGRSAGGGQTTGQRGRG
jgi:hypothetical protein